MAHFSKKHVFYAFLPKNAIFDPRSQILTLKSRILTPKIPDFGPFGPFWAYLGPGTLCEHLNEAPRGYSHSVHKYKHMHKYALLVCKYTKKGLKVGYPRGAQKGQMALFTSAPPFGAYPQIPSFRAQNGVLHTWMEYDPPDGPGTPQDPVWPKGVVFLP